MTEPERKIDANFFQLVVSLQMAAMQQMGKIASPLSGKIERNLDQAGASIDMLAMLAEKTTGNLSVEEKDLIDRVLFELRMNFVDESKKENTDTEKEDVEKEEEKQADPADENTEQDDG